VLSGRIFSNARLVLRNWAATAPPSSPLVVLAVRRRGQLIDAEVAVDSGPIRLARNVYSRLDIDGGLIEIAGSICDATNRCQSLVEA